MRRYQPLPDDDDFALAAEWLRNYETEPQRSRCLVVADWLESFAHEAMLKREARKQGVPIARLRRKLAEISKAGSLNAKQGR